MEQSGAYKYQIPLNLIPSPNLGKVTLVFDSLAITDLEKLLTELCLFKQDTAVIRIKVQLLEGCNIKCVLTSNLEDNLISDELRQIYSIEVTEV